MADIELKVPENTPGEYYVDENCIDCDLCREHAPKNFVRSEDGGYSYLRKQPSHPAERELCEEALENCPVEAIGNDGPIPDYGWHCGCADGNHDH